MGSEGEGWPEFRATSLGCYIVHEDSVQHYEGEGRVAPFELDDLIPLSSPPSHQYGVR
jgi:hypothetical protein